jgi:hypothetical protein
MIEAGGHTRMAAEDAVVVRDQDGKINSTYSYVLIHEQGAGWTDDVTMTTSTCKVNGKDTFGKLAGKWYIPITCEELITGEMEPVECTLSDSVDGKMGMMTGNIKANYFLDSVDLEIKDSTGKTVFFHTMWTTVDKRHDIGENDGLLRNYKDYFDLVAFATPLSKTQFEMGQTYTYTLTAHLHTYESFLVGVQRNKIFYSLLFNFFQIKQIHKERVIL